MTALGLFAGGPLALGAVLTVSYFAFAALPPVPVPAGNPITEPKRVLGKILFFDEQLSTSSVVACATCHIPARGGADPRLARNPGRDGVLNSPDDIFGSPGVIRSDSSNQFQRDAVFGIAPQITGRSANSNINAGFAPELFWDGRARGEFRDPLTGQVVLATGAALESQAAGPPQNSVEMGHDSIDWNIITRRLSLVKPLDLATTRPADVTAALVGNPTYGELFTRAFGDAEITPARVAMAVATYQRTLVADDTPWDRTQEGRAGGMTAQQQQGWQIFQNRSCNSCHTAPHFSDFTFRNIGLRPIVEDTGRQAITGNINDRGKFKVPGLRNAGLKRTFMHNGQFQNMGQVLAFYDAPSPNTDNRDPLINIVRVPPPERAALQDFLVNALTDARVANETFPFDRPVLFTERTQDRATSQGGGITGTGGIVPNMIAQAPPLLGSVMRVGVDSARANAVARLGVSRLAPVNGRITPQFFAGAVATDSTGEATLFWRLTPGDFNGGDVLFVQWLVTDPAAVGGESRSPVFRVPIFCGSSGCATRCDALDYARDNAVNTDDLSDFISDYFSPVPVVGPSATSVPCPDASAPYNSSGFKADFNADCIVNTDDISDFITAYFQGC